MSETGSKNERELANAAHELLLLGRKIVKARALLITLEKELVDVNSDLRDSPQIGHLIEANQQLVLTLLGNLSDPAYGELSDTYLETLEANEQLVIAALSAQDMQARAEQALAQQKGVLAKVAHELRNPLTPISLIAERMVKMPSVELPRMRALIEGQIQHMSRMVEDLLDVSRVSNGRLRLNRCDLDIVQITRDAIETCLPMMSAKNLHFTSSFPDQLMEVHGDAVRLAQILYNLLTNATKYTPNDGTVELSLSSESDMAIIRLTDNGIGVAASALPFIFDPYVQDVNAISFNGTGLGIGLTVVRELVEAHGGTVIGRSEGEGKGSEFIVTLPLSRH